MGSEAPKTYALLVNYIHLPWTRVCGHTQAALLSETVHGRRVNRHTIAVVTNNDNLILDVARDVSHRVPNGRDLLINCRGSSSVIDQVGM